MSINPEVEFEINRELDKFEGSMRNVTELEVRRQELYFLYAALAVRNIDFNLLNQRDNGWYMGERFVGKTIEIACWEITRWMK